MNDSGGSAGLKQLPDRTDRQYFLIKCRLIPLRWTVSFVIFLAVLVTISQWLAISGHTGMTLLLAVMLPAMVQLALISLIIMSAASLKVRVSEQGIEALTFLHKQTLFGRAKRDWNDLHSIRLRKLASPATLMKRLRKERDERLQARSRGTLCELLKSKLSLGMGIEWNKQGFILLDFRNGGVMPFPLAGFSSEALEDLFIATSRWANPMALNPDVIALQRDVLSGNTLSLEDSYTKMWEASLRQRFEVTNFVPLPGGYELQDGQLKVLMLLACGGMSSVYLARQHSGNRVILKEMRVPVNDDLVTASRVHEMFAREARILSRLDHPRIVRVLDHFVAQGRDYLVLDYIPGLTLRQHVEMHGAFSEQDVIELGGQMADILSYLHSFDPQIIHRDLTPDNLILSEPDRRVTLIDFGAAYEYIGNLTGTLIGKQCYIPPEQFRGKAVPASDIYAAGATLYYLLTARDPEPITTARPAAVSPGISAEMDALVAGCTAQEPRQRPQSAAELAYQLNHLARIGSLTQAKDSVTGCAKGAVTVQDADNR